MTASANVADIQPKKERKALKNSLVTKMATTYGVDPDKFYDALSSVAFRQFDGKPPSRAEMLALLVVADQYGLNPFTREIYAFKDKSGKIVPVVGFDGWIRLVNSHEQFDGVRFEASAEMIQIDDDAKMCFSYMTCIMMRKDRKEPIVVTEYLDEIYRPAIQKGGYKISTPHQTHTKRMLRTKSYIQAARIAFGFVGIYDPDEAQEMIDVTPVGQTLGDADSSLSAEVSPAASTDEVPKLPEQAADLDFKLLDQVSAMLIKKAKLSQSPQWDAAHQFAQQKFKGKEHELNYVKNQLTIAESDHEQETAANGLVKHDVVEMVDEVVVEDGEVFEYDPGSPQKGMLYSQQEVEQEQVEQSLSQ